MTMKNSPDTATSTVEVAEFKTLHGLMEQQSMRNVPITRSELRRDIGLGTVVFEAALQKLISGQYVNSCSQRGLTLTHKGMLYILEQHNNLSTS